MKLFSTRNTPENLWRALADAGLVRGAMTVDPVKAHSGDLPSFAKVMLGVAAWISSLLFLAAVGFLLGDLFEDEWVRAILGIIICTSAALYFHKTPPSMFADQIFFILALLGNVLVLSVIAYENIGHSSLPWLLAALIEGGVFVAIPYQPNRFLSASLALVFLYFAGSIGGIAGLFMPLCLALLAIALHFQWRAPQIWPVVAFALSLVPFFAEAWSSIAYESRELSTELPFWLLRICLIGVWLGVVYTMLQRVTGKPLLPQNTSVWLIALLLAAGTWPVPMALFALTVFFLGFSQRDKLLEGIGIVQLLWAVGYYYYALQDTLLFKSLMLSALGAVLLLLYTISHYIFQKKGHDRGEEA
ncbi:MAG: DUF4401 domain-containing protein [Azoarcus sp.]|jgi:hypothetical protein|nr:DUF4401 domain-containing protein [Azoarcus sp.]